MDDNPNAVNAEVQAAILALLAERASMAEFGQDIEAEFGTLGEALGRASETITLADNTARKLGAFTRGEDEGQAVVFAFQLFKKSGDLVLASLEQSDEMSRRLLEVHEELESLRSLRQEFHHTLMVFWFLTTTFQVEAAALGKAHGETLRGLAASIEDLCTRLRSQLGSQFQGLGAVQGLITRTQRDIAAVRLTNRKRLDDAHRRLHADLASLERALAPGTSIDADVAQHLQQARAGVTRVIVALQSQDFVKQKLQHVAAAVERIAVLGNAQGPAASEPSSAAANYAVVHQTALVQCRQLEATMGEVASAERTIVEGLTAVMDAGTLALQSCAKLRRTVVEALSQSRTASSFQANLTELHGVMGAYSGLAKNVGATVEQIRLGVLAGLPNLTSLAAQLRLVGLNAQVRAAHLPPGNAASELSARTRTGADDMLQIAGALVARVEAALTGLLAVGASLNQFVELSAVEQSVLSEETVLACAQLEHMTTGVAAGVRSIERDFDRLRLETRNLLRGLAFPAQASMRIGRASGASDRLQRATLAYSIEHAGSSAVQEQLEALRQAYSIDDERVIHDEVQASRRRDTGTSTGVDGTSDTEHLEDLTSPVQANEVRTSPSTPETTEGARGSQPPDELGDNVELF